MLSRTNRLILVGTGIATLLLPALIPTGECPGCTYFTFMFVNVLFDLARAIVAGEYFGELLYAIGVPALLLIEYALYWSVLYWMTSGMLHLRRTRPKMFVTVIVSVVCIVLLVPAYWYIAPNVSCSLLSNRQGERSSCFEKKALAEHDFGYCDQTHYPDWCSITLSTAIGRETSSIEACGKIAVDRYRQACLFGVAEQRQDTSLCSQITVDEYVYTFDFSQEGCVSRIDQ